MATRMAKPSPKPTTPVKASDWSSLLGDVIRRAEQTNDPRLAGLKKHLGSGQEERVLRRMGIISQRDLDREFPQ